MSISRTNNGLMGQSVLHRSFSSGTISTTESILSESAASSGSIFESADFYKSDAIESMSSATANY